MSNLNIIIKDLESAISKEMNDKKSQKKDFELILEYLNNVNIAEIGYIITDVYKYDGITFHYYRHSLDTRKFATLESATISLKAAEQKHTNLNQQRKEWIMSLLKKYL